MTSSAVLDHDHFCSPTLDPAGALKPSVSTTTSPIASADFMP